MSRWLLIGVLLALPGTAVEAHEVRPAYLQVDEVAPGKFQVQWKQPVMADRRLPLDPVLPAACSEVTARSPEVTDAALIERWTVRCGLRSGTLEIRGLSSTLTDVLVRVGYLDGEVIDRILRPASASLDFTDTSPMAGAYFVLGIEHLLFGIDHILFVVGLALFIRAPWTLFKTVTAFTVAHSVTLAASILGLVKLPQGPVEAVIALSILFLARELMVPEARRSGVTGTAPWVMAFLFGLLHGFGFAGALVDIGLPREQLAGALLLFNLGIEMGQLIVVAVLLAVRWSMRRLSAGQAMLIEKGLTASMGCVAGYWTIGRVLALG